MTDKYPRVTRTQVDLWLIDPVTQAYKNCLDTAVKNANGKLSDGSLIDPTNNDLSMNRIQETIGWRSAIEGLSGFGNTLSLADMIKAEG